MLGRVTMNADTKKSSIHDAMDAALNRRGGAADKILRAAMMTKAVAHGDLKSLIENLVDVRETRREMKSREDADQEVIKRLEYLEEALQDQTKALNKKFDRVIEIFERKPDDVIRRAATGQRTFTDGRGRELTQNIITGKFERRASGNRNAGSDKQDGLDVLRGILDYQKKIHAQNERGNKHVEHGNKLTDRAQRLYERSRGRQGIPPGGGGPGFMGRAGQAAGAFFNRNRAQNGLPVPPTGSNGGMLSNLIDMLPGGQTTASGIAGMLGSTALSAAKSAGSFLMRSAPSAATVGTGLYAIDQIQKNKNKLIQPNSIKDLESFTNFIDPRLRNYLYGQKPSPAANVNALSPEDDAQIKALQEAKEELKKKIDELKRNRPARNFKDYRVDQAEREIAGIDNSISSIRSGGVAGGAGGRAGAGGSSGPYIPGVTPGVGQTQSQAQIDARERLEQAKMPAYNPQFSPGTAAGAGPMQLPGSGATPNGVTGLPITFGGGGGSFEKGGDWSKGGRGTDQLSARGAAVVDHYAQQGVPAHVGAAIAGNINTESKFNTHSSNTSGEDSHGMFQWNDANGGDRWKKAQAWAAANGRDIADPKTQLDYAKVEASQMKMNDGSGRTVWDAMMQSKSAKEASDIWLNNFEKPKERVQNSIERGNNAAEAYNAYNSGKYSSGPAVTASVPGGMQMPAAPRTSMADIGPGTVGDPKAAQFATVNPVSPTGTGGVIDPADFDKIKGTANLARNGDKSYYGDPTSPNFKNDNLTTVTLDSGKTVQVNKVAAESYRGFLNELEASGYKIDSLGGYSPRANVNDPSKLSMHAMGTAIDINPAQNPNQPGQTGPGVTNLPANISDMAAKYGLSWGGDWKSLKDTMHFEYAGQLADSLKKAGVPPAAAAAIATAGMPNAPTIPSGITPAAPAAQASIFSGQTAPPDLKSRTLGAMVKAAMDPNGTPANPNPPATPTAPVKNDSDSGMAEVQGPFSVAEMNRMTGMDKGSNQPTGWRQDPETLKWKPTFDPQNMSAKASLSSTDALVYRGGGQEAKTDDLVNRGAVVGTNKADGLVDVKTIGPNGFVTAKTAIPTPSQNNADWLNENIDSDAGSRALKAKIDAANADAKSFADDFDRRFNGSPSASTPAPYERQPTPAPAAPSPATPAPQANSATPPPENKGGNGSDDDKSEGAGDAAGGSKKMSEIETQINDFGLRPLNSTDAA